MADSMDSNNFQKIKEGDQSAFNKLFDHHYSSLCFFANTYLNDIDQSRSLVQQVFVELWTKREKITINTSIKSYLFQSVKNRSIDFHRKEKNNIQISESIENSIHSPFQDLIEEAELNTRINNSINQLPDKCRKIFILCRFEGLKYAQIAEKLDISVKTVEMQMGIALKKLRKSLSDYQMINLMIFIFSKKQ